MVSRSMAGRAALMHMDSVCTWGHGRTVDRDPQFVGSSKH